MSYMNCRVKRAGLGGALLWGILELILLLPTTVWAGGRTVMVPPPNGVDDTANIQGALNKCVKYGPGCTVQLQAGTYLTKQVVVYNFQGTFKGMSSNRTTIQALYPLFVNIPDAYFNGECMPNITTCLWPTLFVFVDGNIQVSDVNLMELAPPGMATTGWYGAGTETTDLLDLLRFMGKNPTNVSIERIAMEGLPDDSPTSSGFDVISGVTYTGELPRSTTPFDYYFLSGTFTVSNSSFSTMDDGVGQDGFLQSGHIVIGGSPSAGNHFENTYAGMDMGTSESSVFDISYNTSLGIYAGILVEPWLSVFVPSSPSIYSIHDNKFIGTGYFGDGIFLYDDATNPWIQAAVWNNTVEVQNLIEEGIGVYNTKGTAVWNNSVTGSDGTDGIGLWSTTLDTVINNNVSNFTLDPTIGLAQIYLDPSTTYDLVVCAERSNTVLNQGTNNTIVGCQQSTASAEAATSVTRPNLLRKKPPLRK
jgi:hypothetical protein